MGLEIERKFLIVGEGWRQPAERQQRFSQGYLSRDPARTVRVRLSGTSAGEQAFLTIKGKTVGATRAEFEYEIPPADAQQLLLLCEGPLIDKIRHLCEHQGKTWEVDEFFGDNAGLIVAEIELASEDEAFERPDWLGHEVSGDARYYNANLALKPYRSW